MMSLSSLSFLSFLLSASFWSKLGFFISYIATSFIALEVFRLIYSDSTKREAEKFLDAYTAQSSRTTSPRRNAKDQELKKISIDELHHPRTVERISRRTSAATTVAASGPESERTLVGEEKRRRSRAHSTAAQVSAPAHVSGHSASPPRRLRKRSDTLNSASSAEAKADSKGLFRRRRSASPASDAGSKASSRHASPLRRSRKEKDALGLGVGLGISKAPRVRV